MNDFIEGLLLFFVVVALMFAGAAIGYSVARDYTYTAYCQSIGYDNSVEADDIFYCSSDKNLELFYIEWQN